MPTEQRPDGLTIVIMKLCRYGNPGDIKTMSHSTADRLCVTGYAQRWKGPLPLEEKQAAAQVFTPASEFKVSAICPTYNRRKYLPSSIAQFFAQTMKNSELVIVDDSTDSVCDIVPVHPRIQYIRSEKYISTGAKRNLCCEKARGEVIVHWDDDDWQSPNRLEDQVSKLQASKKAVLWYNNILYWNEEEKFACRCFPPAAVMSYAPHGATFCYRRDWWEKNKFGDCVVGEDTNFGRNAVHRQQASWTDAGQNIVIRAHGHADSKTARGNTCSTADGMKTITIPEVPASQIPPEFFAPLLESVPVSVSCGPRVLLAICGWAQGAVNGEHQAARETYLQDVKNFPNLEYRFFIGDGSPNLEDESALQASIRRDCRHQGLTAQPILTPELKSDEVLLPVPDDYRHLTHKSREIHRWSVSNGFDYTFLCYPDTAVDIARLMSSDYAGKDYIGRPLVNPALYAKGGQGRWLSKKAAKIIAHSPVTDWAEDRWVGSLMLQNGITLHKDNRYVDYPDFPRHGNNYISSHLSEAGASAGKVAELLHKVHNMQAEKIDLVVSVVRCHTWQQIAPYANSLAQCGFIGKKLMFVDGVDNNALFHLHQRGFETIPFTTKDPRRFVTRDRFQPVVEYLNKYGDDHRYVVWTDVRDVVFQSDPMVWIEKNIGSSRLLGCSECVLVKSDPEGYNAIWLRSAFPEGSAEFASVWENDIICGGTISGAAGAMRDLLSSIYEMTCRDVNDQTALQYLMRSPKFKDISRVPLNIDGFCATLSWQCGAGQAKLGHALTDACVSFDRENIQVLTPDRSKPFAIVHQYDRDGWWQQAYGRKFM